MNAWRSLFTIKEKYSVIVVYPSLFFRSASPVYYLRLSKFFRHGSQKVLASLTTAKQIVAIQMARENTANKHAAE